MIAALSRILSRRSPRERLMLAVLLFVVVPFAAVLLGAFPLVEKRDAARIVLFEARAEQDWYIARQVEIAALPVAGAAVSAQPPEAVGLGGIEALLIDADLRGAVSRLSNAQGNSVTLAFEAVSFVALMEWLDTVEAEAGYRVTALQVRRGDGAGMVEADLRLEPLS